MRVYRDYGTMRYGFGDSPYRLPNFQFTRYGFAVPPYSYKGGSGVNDSCWSLRLARGPVQTKVREPETASPARETRALAGEEITALRL